VRSDALDAGLGKGHSQAATDVVREQWRVVTAEEDQMLGVLGGSVYEALTQYPLR
jgi:transketolase C-terminal domain/subunit